MTNFLRLLSVIYLMLVWLPLGSLFLGLQFPGMTALQDAGATEIAFIICLALSIVAVAPFVIDLTDVLDQRDRDYCIAVI